MLDVCSFTLETLPLLASGENRGQQFSCFPVGFVQHAQDGVFQIDIDDTALLPSVDEKISIRVRCWSKTLDIPSLLPVRIGMDPTLDIQATVEFDDCRPCHKIILIALEVSTTA
jgi:hypothetical protein